jgi:hypothetical protein
MPRTFVSPFCRQNVISTRRTKQFKHWAQSIPHRNNMFPDYWIHSDVFAKNSGLLFLFMRCSFIVPNVSFSPADPTLFNRLIIINRVLLCHAHLFLRSADKTSFRQDTRNNLAIGLNRSHIGITCFPDYCIHSDVFAKNSGLLFLFMRCSFSKERRFFQQRPSLLVFFFEMAIRRSLFASLIKTQNNRF